MNKDTKSILKLDYVNSVNIRTSMGTLTDTATIRIPKKEKWLGKSLFEYLPKGSQVEIFLGYKERGLQLVFSGYITSVSNVSPISIECEDRMWLLKNTSVKPSRYTDFNLKNFIGEYVPGVRVEIPEPISFGEIVIKDETSVVKVLDNLIKNYPFKCFFCGRTLYCISLSKNASIEDKEHSLCIGNNTISDTLTYIRAEDVKVIIKAINLVDNKTKIEAQSPQNAKEGEVHTVHATACKNENELQSYADNMLRKYKRDSMSGTVTLFGTPFIKKGEKVFINDMVNIERNNKRFIVESVNYSFGQSGYRQEISLGDQI